MRFLAGRRNNQMLGGRLGLAGQGVQGNYMRV